MTSASMFVGEVNARAVLVRLGEPVPRALDPDSIADRYFIGAKWDHDSDDPRIGTVKFVDGSRARRYPDGWAVA